jgi:hypothetical protein
MSNENLSAEQRVRKINLENLSDDQLQNLTKQLGDKLAKMIDSVTEDANKMLKIYGLKAKIGFVLERDSNHSPQE